MNRDIEMKIRFRLRLLHKDGHKPFTLRKYKVLFYDRDPLEDDFLGVSNLDKNGEASISVIPSDWQSADSPMERYPDLYFTLEEDEKVVFKSPVWKDLHFGQTATFSVPGGFKCDLGTFFI